MEEPVSIFYMLGFYNKIYDNSHYIIGWDPKKGKENVDRGTSVMADTSDVGTGGGVRMLEGEANMAKGTY